MVEMDETEDENDGWPKVAQNQTNQVSTAPSRSRKTIYYVITVVENNKDIMKITAHGELNNYFSIHRKQFCKITFHGYHGNHD